LIQINLFTYGGGVGDTRLLPKDEEMEEFRIDSTVGTRSKV